MDANIEKRTQLEELLVGTGASDFAAFEQRIGSFCPFEAIGMVRQEIKHSHFLAYLLNPARPHGFGTEILQKFMGIVFQNCSEPGSLNPLALHFLNLDQAIVSTERWDIDLLIELPPAREHGGVIIAVELKIDAKESPGQLEKYQNRVEAEFPDQDHYFVFLTRDGDEPSKEIYTPLDLSVIVEMLEVFAENETKSAASDFLMAYTRMIRKHILTDQELDELARKIWNRHNEALELLVELKPDFQSEILQTISELDGHQTWIPKEVDLTISQDKRSPRILRFIIKEWSEINRFATDGFNWLESGHVMCLELNAMPSGVIKFSFVIGPGDEDMRRAITDSTWAKIDQGFLPKGGFSQKNQGHKQLSSKGVLTAEKSNEFMSADDGLQKAAKHVTNECRAFLSKYLSIYNEIVRDAAKAVQDT